MTPRDLFALAYRVGVASPLLSLNARLAQARRFEHGAR